MEHLFTVNYVEKTKIKKKEAGNGKKYRKTEIFRGMRESLSENKWAKEGKREKKYEREGRMSQYKREW